LVQQSNWKLKRKPSKNWSHQKKLQWSQCKWFPMLLLSWVLLIRTLTFPQKDMVEPVVPSIPHSTKSPRNFPSLRMHMRDLAFNIHSAIPSKPPIYHCPFQTGHPSVTYFPGKLCGNATLIISHIFRVDSIDWISFRPHQTGFYIFFRVVWELVLFLRLER
jgi:hypothetical protein